MLETNWGAEGDAAKGEVAFPRAVVVGRRPHTNVFIPSPSVMRRCVDVPILAAGGRPPRCRAIFDPSGAQRIAAAATRGRANCAVILVELNE